MHSQYGLPAWSKEALLVKPVKQLQLGQGGMDLITVNEEGFNMFVDLNSCWTKLSIFVDFGIKRSIFHNKILISSLKYVRNPKS